MTMTATVIIIIVCVVAAAIAAVWFFSGKFFKQETSSSDQPSLMKGMHLLAEGEHDMVLDEFKQLALKGKIIPEMYMVMAVLYRKKGEFAKAVRINEGLLMRSDLTQGEILTVLKELVKDYRATGSISKAEEYLGKVPKSLSVPEVCVIKAELASENGDHEESIRMYNKAAKMTDSSYDEQIAEEYIKMAEKSPDNTQKVKYLKNALKHYTDNNRIYFDLADIYFGEGKHSEAIAELNTILDKNLVHSREDMQRIENAYFQNGEFDSLIQTMSAQVAAHCEDPAPYLFLANYYSKLNDVERAREVLKDYILQVGPKVLVVKAYARMTEDPVLARIVRFENNYQCRDCGEQAGEYSEICPNCGNSGTIKYL